MVHQRTRPPSQAAGRGGYRGANQSTKCLNCGFGRGQFGVEFCDDFCSLDCYTSAKVTGRKLPRDARCQGKNDGGEATPWPRGLLVEAPPAPKPWRGRTWSNDTVSWRTPFTFNSCSNLSAEDSSSIESVADWPNGGGTGGGVVREGRGGCRDDVVVDERGADCGFGVAGGTHRNSAGGSNTVDKRGPAVVSGGGAASSNGVSGGRMVGDGVGYNSSSNNDAATRNMNSCCGEGVQDAGGGMQRREGGVNSRSRGASAGGGVGGGDGDSSGVGGNGGGETGGVLRHDLPPLAPVPRAGAFLQQHRRAQSGGRDINARVLSFAPTPAKTTPTPPSNDAFASAGKVHPTLPPASGQVRTKLGGMTAVGVGVGVGVSVSTLGEEASSFRETGAECAATMGGPGGGGGGGTAVPRLGVETLEGGRGGDSNGVPGTGRGDGAAGVGQEGGAVATGAGKSATGIDGKSATGVEGAAAVEATAVIGEEADVSGERVPSMDGLLVGTRCGVAAGAGAGGAGAEGEDVEVMKQIMSCAPVRTYPTRVAIRQWRHMFLP